MKFKNLFWIGLLFLCLSAQAMDPVATIQGHVQSNQKNIQIAGKNIELDEKGDFLFEMELEYSTIISLRAGRESYELFIAPEKTLELRLEKGKMLFIGELATENNYLLEEKELSNQIDAFFNKNWYALCRKEEAAYVRIIDSIENVLLSGLKTKALNPVFREVNAAAIGYSFDRLLLRYPQYHFNYTGNRITLSAGTLNKINSDPDRPQYRYLESYQKYVKTWMEKEVEEAVSQQKALDFYRDKVVLDKALALIKKEFNSSYLKDYWSFEYIKSHLDSYTWINGKSYLEAFIKDASTPSFVEQAQALRARLLKAREDHQIHIYKSVKGYQLEAHIFYPENFEKGKTYPSLAAFHGGGWQSGNASWTFESARHAADKGMIGVAVEYRLSNRADITPQEAMEDSRDLILWLRKNAATLGIDTKKIVGKGLSAGGHLISAISVLQEQGGQARPNALVLVSPAIDTSDDYFKSLLGKGKNPDELSALKNLSPDQNIPPTLILQGRTDRLTPTSFAQAYQAKMDSLGYVCELKIYEGCGHLFTPSHLDDTGMPQADPAIMKKAIEEQDIFLRKLGFIK